MGHAAARLHPSHHRAPPSIGEQLDGASRAIEGCFLESGEVLGHAVEGLARLIASLDRLGKVLDAETVAATTAELQAAADNLLALPERHADRTRAIVGLTGAAERLDSGISDMRRALAYLRVFAINIKITAGGIAEAGKEFSDFSQEISDCIALGLGRIDAFEADLNALRGRFQTALTHEHGLKAQCDKLLPAVPNGLAESAAAMVAHHQHVGEVAAQVVDLARDVQKRVGMTLAGLQIGDITRQRIEHASQALQLLAAVEGLTPEQNDRMAAFVYRLLAAQLQATAEDFHRDVARIGDAMGGMAADATDILRLRDVALGRAKGDDEGFLRQLEKHVGQALVLIGDMSRADSKALEMGASATAAAADLSAQIGGLRTIKMDVQYMALNATLKCGRMGDNGKPLAVIALELRVHAAQMETSAQEALSALDRLSGDAASLSNVDANATEGRADAVGDALSDVAARLRHVGDTVDADLKSLAGDGDAVALALRRATQRLSVQREIGAVVDAAATALAESAGDEEPETADIAEPLRDLLALIAKRYTMAQEREVHRHMAGDLVAEAPPAAVAETKAPAAELELEDVLF